MKNNQMRLQNLTNQEMLEISGGQTPPPWWWNPWVALAGGLVYCAKTAVEDWSCFKDGLAGNDFKHK
jgi:hypothetical protein